MKNLKKLKKCEENNNFFKKKKKHEENNEKWWNMKKNKWKIMKMQKMNKNEEIQLRTQNSWRFPGFAVVVVSFFYEIWDDFHDFVSERLFTKKINNQFWESPLFLGGVTIFIGRKTKTHFLQTKIVRYTSLTTKISHDNNHRTSKHASKSWRSDGSPSCLVCHHTGGSNSTTHNNESRKTQHDNNQNQRKHFRWGQLLSQKLFFYNH